MSRLALVRSVLELKCPRCRQSDLFSRKHLLVYKDMLKMPEKCTHCGQEFEIEPGFYYGALWTSYPVVVVVELPFLLLALFSEELTPWFWFSLMLVAFVVLFPFMLRLGRSIWIHIWVKYDPDKKE